MTLILDLSFLQVAAMLKIFSSLTILTMLLIILQKELGGHTKYGMETTNSNS